MNPLEREAHTTSSLLAMELVVRALIASHPDRRGLKAKLQAFATEFLDRAVEHGFETSATPQESAQAVELYRAALKRWLDFV